MVARGCRPPTSIAVLFPCSECRFIIKIDKGQSGICRRRPRRKCRRYKIDNAGHPKVFDDVSHFYVTATITACPGWYTHFSISLGSVARPSHIDIRRVTVFLIKFGALFIIVGADRRIYVKVTD